MAPRPTVHVFGTVHTWDTFQVRDRQSPDESFTRTAASLDVITDEGGFLSVYVRPDDLRGMPEPARGSRFAAVCSLGVLSRRSGSPEVQCSYVRSITDEDSPV